MTTTAPDWTPRANPAEDYERYLVPAFFHAFAGELVSLAAPWPGERVLDIACGTGALTRLLVERVGPNGHVTGLDLSAGMLAVARTLLDEPNVDWHEGSALELPFPDGSFDLVTCQQGLQFFPDRPAGVREMRRVLKPGGRLALHRVQPGLEAFGGSARPAGGAGGGATAALLAERCRDAAGTRARGGIWLCGGADRWAGGALPLPDGVSAPHRDGRARDARCARYRGRGRSPAPAG